MTELIYRINDENLRYGTVDGKPYPTGDIELVGELIRCKDCKHYNKESCFLWDGDIDDYNYAVPKDDDFCSRAERRAE